MGRHSITRGIVLRVSRFAEYHKRLLLLTDEAGIVEVIAYGACKSKSKFAGITESFTVLRVWLYHDPVKNQYKLSDAEVMADFDGIRKDVDRFYAAAIMAELVHATYAGGGEHRTLLELLVAGFGTLETVSGGRIDLLLVQMIDGLLDAIGYPVIVEECDGCGAAISTGEYRYVASGGEVLCPRCRRNGAVPMTPGAVAYLSHTRGLSFESASRVAIDEESLEGLKAAMLRIAQRVAERPLQSLRSQQAGW